MAMGCGHHPRRIGSDSLRLCFQAFRGDRVEPTAAGQFGDFVGGYIGSFFALVSIVLLVRTLRHQRDDFHVQAFTAKYFELVKLHRDNVAEMELQGSNGRRIFVQLIRELRAILVIARQLAEERGLAAR